MSMLEKALVGALLFHPDKIDEVRNRIMPIDFADSRNQTIMTVAYGMAKPFDWIMVADKFNHNPEMFRYLTECVNTAYALDNLNLYIESVKTESPNRRIRASAKALADNVDLLPQHKAELIAIDNDKPTTYQTAGEIFKQCLPNMDDKPNEGIMSGFKDIDDKLCGFQPGNLIILAARPAMGKTLLAVNMANNIAIVNKQPVLFFSLEMVNKEIINRIASYYTGINSSKFLKKDFTQEEWQRLFDASKYFTNSKLHICDKSAATLDDIRAQARHMQNTIGLKALFVDHLSLMGDKADNEVLRLGMLTRGLKAIAKDFNIPVIVITQLNRESDKRENKRPIMSDIRQSGEIEQDADVIMFLYRENYNNILHPNDNIAELDIAKHRNGEIGTVRLKYNFSVCEFKDL